MSKVTPNGPAPRGARANTRPTTKAAGQADPGPATTPAAEPPSTQESPAPDPKAEPGPDETSEDKGGRSRKGSGQA